MPEVKWNCKIENGILFIIKFGVWSKSASTANDDKEESYIVPIPG